MRHWRPLFVCWVGFLVFGSLVAPRAQERQVSGETAASLEIKSAYVLEEGKIHFTPFVFIHWAAQARRYADIDVDQPTPEQLGRLRQNIDSFGNSRVAYEAPLESALEGGFYYLLTDDGVEKLRPQSLSGEVRFSFDAEKKKILEVVHSGFVLAVPASGEPATGGGFVLWSETPLEMSTLAVTTDAEDELFLRSRMENGKVRWFFQEGGRTTPFYEMEGTWPEEFLAAYAVTVQPGHRRFLFVRWEPDRACESVCCEFAYDLFEIGRELEPVNFAYYGCDV